MGTFWENETFLHHNGQDYMSVCICQKCIARRLRGVAPVVECLSSKNEAEYKYQH
jgi:hypothetical protein